MKNGVLSDFMVFTMTVCAVSTALGVKLGGGDRLFAVFVAVMAFMFFLILLAEYVLKNVRQELSVQPHTQGAGYQPVASSIPSSPPGAE